MHQIFASHYNMRGLKCEDFGYPDLSLVISAEGDVPATRLDFERTVYSDMRGRHAYSLSAYEKLAIKKGTRLQHLPL